MSDTPTEDAGPDEQPAVSWQDQYARSMREQHQATQAAARLEGENQTADDEASGEEAAQ